MNRLPEEYILGRWMAGLDLNPLWLDVFERTITSPPEWWHEDQGPVGGPEYFDDALSVVTAEWMHQRPEQAVPHVIRLLDSPALRAQGLLTLYAAVELGAYALPAEIGDHLPSLVEHVPEMDDRMVLHLIYALKSVDGPRRESLLRQVAERLPTGHAHSTKALKAVSAIENS